MKRLGRVLGSLLAVALTVFSMQAFAAAQMGGRDFNHMTTGFILSGGHAVAACETCHIGGVFKGTPRACDGCHSTGRRIIATPKNSSHIVTDAPCETCHFNTATWLGARFNHGNARPGQCATCHNGRLSFAKPSTHNTGNKATQSCDSCHRSSSWLPATWNHTGAAAGICSSCHISGAEVSLANRRPSDHLSVITGKYTTRLRSVDECDECHSFVPNWRPAAYKHNGAGAGACSGCHYNTGVTTFDHTRVVSGADCGACHRSKTTWKSASQHTGNEAGICASCHSTKPRSSKHTLYVASVSCDACHTQATWTTGHTTGSVKTYCGACHSADSKAVKEHGTISTTSKYYNCGNCHKTTGW